MGDIGFYGSRLFLLASEAATASQSPLDKLGIDPWKLGIQLISFLAFIFLLWKFALGPITKMLDTRTERIKEGIEAGERMQAELKATASKNEEALRAAQQQAQQILADSKAAGDAALARAKEEAEKQAEEYLARARQTLQAETEQARVQLRSEVADLAVLAATKIVRKELDPATQAALIDETLKEAGKGGGQPQA
jgi:F-type H+-transporting ATPase subunit b